MATQVVGGLWFAVMAVAAFGAPARLRNDEMYYIWNDATLERLQVVGVLAAVGVVLFAAGWVVRHKVAD